MTDLITKIKDSTIIRQQPTPDITLCMLEAQDKVTNTLNSVQQKRAIDRYMNDVKTCMGENTEEFNSWLLSVEKVTTITNTDSKEIHFKKAEGNLLKFLYAVNLKRCSWLTLKERMRTKSSKFKHLVTHVWPY